MQHWGASRSVLWAPFAGLGRRQGHVARGSSQLACVQRGSHAGGLGSARMPLVLACRPLGLGPAGPLMPLQVRAGAWAPRLAHAHGLAPRSARAARFANGAGSLRPSRRRLGDDCVSRSGSWPGGARGRSCERGCARPWLRPWVRALLRDCGQVALACAERLAAGSCICRSAFRSLVCRSAVSVPTCLLQVGLLRLLAPSFVGADLSAPCLQQNGLL